MVIVNDRFYACEEGDFENLIDLMEVKVLSITNKYHAPLWSILFNIGTTKPFYKNFINEQEARGEYQLIQDAWVDLKTGRLAE